MSSSASTSDSGLGATGSSESRFGPLRSPVKAGAFWAAVLLPFCTLGLLASGLETPTGYALLAALLAGNVLALVVGHNYRR